MKSLKIKSLILAMCYLTTPLLGYLSPQEEKIYLEKFSPPQELRLGIDLFLSNTTARDFFVNRTRHQYLPKLGVRRFTAGDRLRWSIDQKNLKNNWESKYVPMYEALCSEGNITPLADLNKNSFILASDIYWPKHVLKILAAFFITINFMNSLKNIMHASCMPFKNISIIYRECQQNFQTVTMLLWLKKSTTSLHHE